MHYFITDLDGTLIDNRRRKHYCVNLVAGGRFSFDEVNQGYLLRHLDLTEEETQRIIELFLSNAYINDPVCRDALVPGAQRLLLALQEHGIGIVYLTGRHHDRAREDSMRGGTIENLGHWGLPVPDGETIHLVMKPQRHSKDEEFKRYEYARWAQIGQIFAIMGNRPGDFPPITSEITRLRFVIDFLNEPGLCFPVETTRVVDCNEAYTALIKHAGETS